MKEIGIRKVVGGQRSQLLWQFTGESLFNFIFSLLAAVGLAYLLLPIFNRLVERNITFIENSFILCTLAVLFISALLAGLYPAMALSSFKTVDILKGKRRITGKGVIPKNLLVMFQFSITIILIISSLVVFLQIRYVQKKPLGYNREHVVLMRRADKGVTRNFHAFKNTLLKNPKVIGITTSDHPPTDVGNRWGGREYITDEGVTVKRFPSYLLWIDYNYLDFYDTEIIKGRNFSAAYGTDEENAVILNETFVQNLNWNDPIGKKIQVWNKQEKVVIGVVKDFHFQSMHNEIAPILIFCRPDNYYIQIRIQSDHMPETLKFLRKAYESYRIRYPFEYNFLDESYDQMYNSDRKLAQMLVSFSGLAIFIACLGIFGLASYATETRIKEIGIRKVLGASGPGIFMHLSRGFTKWVVVANIFAWPIAYLAMNKWLQNFAYRIDMSVWIFILAGLVALVIALVTVSYQAIKAAMANPIESLRYE